MINNPVIAKRESHGEVYLTAEYMGEHSELSSGCVKIYLPDLRQDSVALFAVAGSRVLLAWKESTNSWMCQYYSTAGVKWKASSFSYDAEELDDIMQWFVNPDNVYEHATWSMYQLIQ